MMIIAVMMGSGVTLPVTGTPLLQLQMPSHLQSKPLKNPPALCIMQDYGSIKYRTTKLINPVKVSVNDVCYPIVVECRFVPLES